MKYSARYMDIKNRPMLMVHNNTMDKLEFLWILVKIGLGICAIYMAFITVAFFFKNIWI